METASLLSSLNDECRSDNYVEPHYQEWYRLAVDTLVEHGAEAYQEFLTKERAADFLAEEEVSYILQHVQRLAPSPACSPDGSGDDASSLGTYWPEESDVEAPDLDLGWPYVMPGLLGGTQVELLFHPPRAQLLTIKETIRKMVKEARKVVALVMDIFTDVDIFKEVVEASARGVSVYILLDESNFCHFLKMTEKQGCQVQRLRNIRVRTVKGQDYISKTGAKFHGKLEQKFLLVDCQKVLYGSYSYMWSFEKAHLSMAQLISGQLVESFDEEFRTLYARSCVPGALAPEGAVRARPGRARWENGLGPRSVSSLASLSSRRNLLWRPAGTPRVDAGFAPQPRGLHAPLEPDKYSYGGRNHGYRPHFLPPTNGPSPAARAFQPGALAEGWKRHSYAGEPSETPPFLLPGRAALHALPAPPAWRRPADALSVASSARGHGDAPSASLAERLAPRKSGLLGERNAAVRRSFHGTDSHVRSLQQRMPTLERTTRTFLRNWRLESYLNDRADAAPDAGGSLAGERPDGPDGALYARSRLRSSFVFKPTLPEQKEVNSCTTSSSNSTIIGSQGSDTSRPAPDSPAAAPPPEDAPAPAPPASPEPAIHGANGHAEPDRRAPPRTAQDEQRLKRRSFPSFELARAGLDPAKPSLYGTLTRARARPPAPPAAPPPPLHGSRSLHSVAPGPERADAAAPAPRSPAPGRAAKSASMAALLDAPGEEPGRELAPRKEGKASPSFLKKGSQKLRSLLSLTPDRKDGLSRARAPAFYRLCSSSDTLLSEADDGPAPRKSEPKADAAPPPRPAGGSVQRSLEDVRAGPASPRPGERPPLERPGDASAPRFNTEQIQYRDPREAPAASPGLLRSRSAAGQRVYSRFEPFCKLEGALPPPGSPARPRAARPEARASALGYGGSGASPALGYGGAAYRPFPPGGENKLRGFMQRFGSLINKSK